MFELIQVGEKTYYINFPSKMGIYRINEHDVFLIDSGNGQTSGKKVKKILESQGWNLKGIINTHAHADHIGGNRYLQEAYQCEIFMDDRERFFAEYSFFEPAFLYGGYPSAGIRNKYLQAESSKTKGFSTVTLPAGLSIIELPGHSPVMCGVVTSDGICFLGDCLVGENTIEKYRIIFLYDIGAYFRTLETLESLAYKLYIPSHADPTPDLQPLIIANRKATYTVMEDILNICKDPKGFDEILKILYDATGFQMDFNQHVLVGFTIRSYLSYLYDIGKLTVDFSDNILKWVVVKS